MVGEVEGKPLFHPPLHHCRRNANVSMVGKLEEKHIFQPPNQIRPSEKIKSSLVETVKVKYTFQAPLSQLFGPK